MRVAISKIITTGFIEKCTSKRIDVIVYSSLGKNIDLAKVSKSFKLINALDDVEKGIWFNFNLVLTQLKPFKNKYSSLFSYNGINLEEALQKDLFWSFFQDYGLRYHADKLKQEGHDIFLYSQRNFFVKNASLIRSLFFDKTIFYQSNTKSFDQKRTKKIAFRINNKSTPTIYGNLLDVLGRENIISFQSKYISQKEELIESLNPIFSENIETSLSYQKVFIPFFTKLRLLFSTVDTEFLITFLIVYKRLCNHINEYEKLFKSGIKKMLLNAGENEGEGNVVCALAKKYSVKTYNYMNGSKANSPQQLNTYFDYWFMPDKSTQDLISSSCKIPERQLPVTGHLLQEVAQKHIYSGTLDKHLNSIEHKKVIALFTSPIFNDEINSVLSFLSSYLEKHIDLVVLIRKHPRDRNPRNVNSSSIIEIEPVSQELSEISLFDLLLKSDVAISFSSTVSWQTTWFNIPSLNFEISEKSRLPFVDNEKIIHVNSIGKLQQNLNKYLYSNDSIGPTIEIHHAAKDIASFIFED